MLKKFNNVQHFKLKPSRYFLYFQWSLYMVATLLVLWCSLDWFFKVFLLLLLGLEYFRQQVISHDKNHIDAFEIRDNKLFLQRQYDEYPQEISQISIKQNRIFAELELHLKDEIRSEFICRDSFHSKAHFSLLMQNLRFNHL